jgi:hypothetical protein
MKITRKQALANGTLVDLYSKYPDIPRLQEYPVACTSKVWQLIVEAQKNPDCRISTLEIVYDILYMSINYITEQISENEHLFKFKIMEEDYTLKAVLHHGDHGEPVITIKTRYED